MWLMTCRIFCSLAQDQGGTNYFLKWMVGNVKINRLPIDIRRKSEKRPWFNPGQARRPIALGELIRIEFRQFNLISAQFVYSNRHIERDRCDHNLALWYRNFETEPIHHYLDLPISENISHWFRQRPDFRINNSQGYSDNKGWNSHSADVCVPLDEQVIMLAPYS